MQHQYTVSINFEIIQYFWHCSDDDKYLCFQFVCPCKCKWTLRPAYLTDEFIQDILKTNVQSQLGLIWFCVLMAIVMTNIASFAFDLTFQAKIKISALYKSLYHSLKYPNTVSNDFLY